MSTFSQNLLNPYSSSSRVAFIKPSNYSNKVLVGHWQEDRANQIEIPIKDEPRTTTYSDDFYAKPYSTECHNARWDLRVESEITGLYPPKRDIKHPSYFENYLSTYDLAFNHIPRCLKAIDPGNLTCVFGLPQPKTDFTETFGNLTHYGLVENKKEIWEYENQPVRNLTTKYNEDYPPPDQSYYKFKRYGIPMYTYLIHLVSQALNLFK